MPKVSQWLRRYQIALLLSRLLALQSNFDALWVMRFDGCLMKSDFLKWFLVALSVKGIIFILSISIFKEDWSVTVDGFWSFISRYSNSYIVPIDTLIHLGEYTAYYPMPGYGAFYLFFRMFFEKLNAIILFQLLISSVTVVCLARLCEIIFYYLLFPIHYDFNFSAYRRNACL